MVTEFMELGVCGRPLFFTYGHIYFEHILTELMFTHLQ